MEAMEALAKAARRSGTPLVCIGPAIGRSKSYVSVKINKGTDPQAGTLAKMLGACGWSLCAVPDAEVPESALRIG